jgi:hypothetical protein
MLKEMKILKLKHIFESNHNPLQRNCGQQRTKNACRIWRAENKEHPQNLKEMEISLEDTAVGRKKIVLEQQLNTATLSMSPMKWKELLEIQKQKWGEEEVVGATEEVIGGAEGV